MGLKFTILGCGGSFGVPYAGNDWGKCDPNEPKNRRTRCSLLVQSEVANVVIDTGPDFREQMITHAVHSLDGVLYTHKHYDHVAGIDDLRIYAIRKNKTLPAYSDQNTQDTLMSNKDYLLKGEHPNYPEILTLYGLKPFEQFTIKDIGVEAHTLDHVTLTSTGYRFDDLAYSVDMRDITQEKTFQALQGIHTWIVDGGAYHFTTPSVHATFEHVMLLNETIKAKRVILTSLSKSIDYHQASQDLPEGFELAYDGMVIET